MDCSTVSAVHIAIDADAQAQIHFLTVEPAHAVALVEQLDSAARQLRAFLQQQDMANVIQIRRA